MERVMTNGLNNAMATSTCLWCYVCMVYKMTKWKILFFFFLKTHKIKSHIKSFLRFMIQCFFMFCFMFEKILLWSFVIKYESHSNRLIVLNSGQLLNPYRSFSYIYLQKNKNQGYWWNAQFLFSLTPFFYPFTFSLFKRRIMT